MNLLDKILQIFEPKSIDKIDIVEKFSTLSISFELVNYKIFSFEKLSEVTNSITGNDHFSLSIKIGENDSILLKENSKIKDFKEDIKEDRKIFENEPVFFKFEVSKETDEYVSIYIFEEFKKFWNVTSLIKLLSLLRKHRNKYNRNDFLLIEEDEQQFESENIKFLTKLNANISSINSSISDNCHFGNIEEYPFNPRYFNLLYNGEDTKSNPIIDSLNKLCVLFSVISIFDITSITKGEFYYKLNGYKTFEGKVDVNKINSSYRLNYYKIYDWIYSGESNIDDKIGLSRNIISLSFIEGSLELPATVYLSIQSGYKTYLQENISKYIEIRNWITDELSWVSQKSSEITSTFFSNYQKSIFTFLSFFISVFILRFLKIGKIDDVFSKEVTIFSLSFLLISLVYMFFSIWNLESEKSRLERKYENIKYRYTDLLDENDIKRILKDDSEFKYEISFIDKRKNNYILLWVITISILISTIFCVSSYINWCIIIDSIKGILNLADKNA